MTGSLEEQFRRIAEAGYDGVESAVEEISDSEKFKSLLAEYHLDYTPLIYTEGASHFESFKRLIKLASDFAPKRIIAHAGRDLWGFEDHLRFFKGALLIENEYGILIAHETHRRRPLFSP